MKIELFKNNDGLLIPDAVKAGVYKVSVVLESDKSKRFTLYIGESFSLIARCGNHVYNAYKSPSYFGLTEEQFNDDRLILEFSIYEIVDEVWVDDDERDLILRQHEREAIIKEKPVSQFSTSDHVRPDAKDSVTAAINKLLNIND